MFSSSVNSNFPRRRNPEVRHGSASGRNNIASVVLSTTTPPPPALVSRVLCCDVPLLLRRWFHASCVATYPFSDVKSTRLLALVGNPWHETQPIPVHPFLITKRWRTHPIRSDAVTVKNISHLWCWFPYSSNLLWRSVR